MRTQSRKVTPRVKAGKVQKKNNHHPTYNYWDHEVPAPVIDRERPGSGCRHLLTKGDIERFIAILPDWEELSKGLKAIILAERSDCYGWADDGIVAVCSWDRDLWQDYRPDFFKEHRHVLERLGVETERLSSGEVRCKFTEAQARGFQLLHILLHELGHHHDRMTTKSKRHSRGEPYAEEYALRYMDRIWNDYIRVFELY